jgi:glycosyltransferase involved in cell wall biosynthesis
MGGSTAVALEIAKGLNSVENHIIFVGVEPLFNEYQVLCKTLGFDYTYVEKKQGLDLLFLLAVVTKVSALDSGFKILVHTSSVIPAILLLKTLSLRQFYFVEHQSLRNKTQSESFFSGLATKLFIKRIFLSEYASSHYPYLRNKAVLSNGIDMKKYSPGNRIRRNVQTLVLGMASRIDEQREHDILVRACAELRKQGTQLKLKLAGNDLGRLNGVNQLVSELDFEGSFEYVGVLNENEMLDFFNSIDIYVHATKYETLSTSILQAMSCGLPVLASDIPENARNFESISTYKTGNVHDLQRVLKELTESENLRYLGENCRAEVEKKYSNVKMVESYKKLLWG